jgi:hypothetical protein
MTTSVSRTLKITLAAVVLFMAVFVILYLLGS